MLGVFFLRHSVEKVATNDAVPVKATQRDGTRQTP